MVLFLMLNNIVPNLEPIHDPETFAEHLTKSDRRQYSPVGMLILLNKLVFALGTNQGSLRYL